jgi:hypothetical protein
MPLTFYSMSLDAVVIRDMIEDPTLDVPMKITSNGTLFVKGQFIEATRSYVIPFDPSPCSMDMSGSYAIDTFDCYTAEEVFSLPNAGTGWSGLWDISTNYAQSVATEFFNYTSGSITGDSINGGTGWNNTASIVTNA